MIDLFSQLLNSIESGMLSQKDRNQWIQSLAGLGVKEEDTQEFLVILGKIARLQSLVLAARPKGGFPTRIYTEEETKKIDAACRGQLLHFEQVGLLPPELREVVIDQAMRLEDIELDILHFRALALAVLFHQSSLDVILASYQALAQAKVSAVH